MYRYHRISSFLPPFSFFSLFTLFSLCCVSFEGASRGWSVMILRVKGGSLLDVSLVAPSLSLLVWVRIGTPTHGVDIRSLCLLSHLTFCERMVRLNSSNTIIPGLRTMILHCCFNAVERVHRSNLFMYYLPSCVTLIVRNLLFQTRSSRCVDMFKELGPEYDK